MLLKEIMKRNRNNSSAVQPRRNCFFSNLKIEKLFIFLFVLFIDKKLMIHFEKLNQKLVFCSLLRNIQWEPENWGIGRRHWINNKCIWCCYKENSFMRWLNIIPPLLWSYFTPKNKYKRNIFPLRQLSHKPSLGLYLLLQKMWAKSV